jgi:hypothetical protein
MDVEDIDIKIDLTKNGKYKKNAIIYITNYMKETISPE